MAVFEIGESGCRAELPPVKVAVIRNQSETMLSPSHDIVPFLEAQGPRYWCVTSFDERDFGGALGAEAEFDAIVLGYNATLYSQELREALRESPPSAPVLLLHQRERYCFDFLHEDLALDLASLGRSVHEAVPPPERDHDFEPLLNWPHAGLLTGGRLRAEAISGLSFSPDGAWRVVMEGERAAQRLPLLVRTHADHEKRIVACSLLLRPDPVEAHGKLLVNLLIYCAFGWPDVGLIELDGDDGRLRRLEPGMAMWSGRAVRVTVPGDADLPIGSWPLSCVKRIVATEQLPPARAERLEAAQPWLHRGGELVRVGRDGDLTATASLNDRFVVARQWSMWFGTVAEAEWLKRLSLARAVLGMLQTLARDPEQVRDDVRLCTEPPAYHAEVAQLLDSRMKRGNVENTISATAAALDLDRLVGYQGLSSHQRRGARRWLRKRLAGANRADQFDILRCLGSRRRLRRHLHEMRDQWDAKDAQRRVDALVATRLREAVHACWPRGDEPADLLPEAAVTALDSPQVVQDLHRGPLLCADFLCALYARPPKTTGAKTTLFDPCRYPDSTAEALSGVRTRGLFTRAADVRAVCAHTGALLRHLERQPAGLRLLDGGGELPASAAESLLQEATEARHGERMARRDVPALGIAVLVLGALVLGGAAIGLSELWEVSGLTVRVDPWWVLPLAVIVPAAVLVLLRTTVLAHPERQQRGDLQLAQHVMAAAALVVALVAGTLAWRVAAPEGGVTTFAATLGPVVGATVFAALSLVLLRYSLLPDWAAGLVGLGGDFKSPLGLIMTKVKERRSRVSPTPPAGGP